MVADFLQLKQNVYWLQEVAVKQLVRIQGSVEVV